MLCTLRNTGEHTGKNVGAVRATNSVCEIGLVFYLLDTLLDSWSTSVRFCELAASSVIVMINTVQALAD
jgi:hypothetical protein